MTNVESPTNVEAKAEPVLDQTQASGEDINGTQQFLAPVVIAMQALAIDGKQAHWHVRGENFIAVHELLDKVVTARAEVRGPRRRADRRPRPAGRRSPDDHRREEPAAADEGRASRTTAR